MKRNRLPRWLLLGIPGAVIAVAALSPRLAAQKATPPVAATATGAELEALRAELKTIRDQLPGQAHVMMDVGHHFSGLWFAVQQRNWALAQFMFNEMQSHLRWAVRVRPVRKLSTGQELQLAGILEALEHGVIDKVKETIDGKNPKDFQRAYRTLIEGCNSCHRAAEKPYLKVRVPARLGEPLDLSPSPAVL